MKDICMHINVRIHGHLTFCKLDYSLCCHRSITINLVVISVYVAVSVVGIVNTRDILISFEMT